ncbi:hypothetical protein ACINLE_03630 [Bacillus sp. z60-18]|uniref:hypothetical protein n=1 Tax=Bacillus TaxID=1386 RepID=UPI000989B721|nr:MULTISPECIES: hypothetical protein [Bacillus]WFA04989.1 hypothetical protein P3X63_20850 [Bacillus sp. HSf4]
MDQNQQKSTAMRLKKIADHIEDTREEYQHLLLQVKQMIRDIEDKTISNDEEAQKKLSSTYEQMKEYALFVESIESFLKSSARNIKTKRES